MTPAYGEFLLADVLPFVEKELGITLTTDSGRESFAAYQAAASVHSIPLGIFRQLWWCDQSLRVVCEYSRGA